MSPIPVGGAQAAAELQIAGRARLLEQEDDGAIATLVVEPLLAVAGGVVGGIAVTAALWVACWRAAERRAIHRALGHL